MASQQLGPSELMAVSPDAREFLAQVDLDEGVDPFGAPIRYEGDSPVVSPPRDRWAGAQASQHGSALSQRFQERCILLTPTHVIGVGELRNHVAQRRVALDESTEPLTLTVEFDIEMGARLELTPLERQRRVHVQARIRMWNEWFIRRLAARLAESLIGESFQDNPQHIVVPDRQHLDVDVTARGSLFLWMERTCSTFPRTSGDTLPLASVLVEDLVALGATRMGDFWELNATELLELWTPVRLLPTEFSVHALRVLRTVHSQAACRSATSSTPGETVLPCPVGDSVELPVRDVLTGESGPKWPRVGIPSFSVPKSIF